MLILAQAIDQLPVAEWLPIAVMLIAGVALWAAGRRLLRGAFTALGLLAGLGIGWIVGLAVQPTVPAWVVAVAGAIVLAVAATLAYRAAVGVGLALVLAIAAPLALWAKADPASLGEAANGARESLQNGDIASDAAPDALDQWLEEIRGRGGDDEADDAQAPRPLGDHLAAARPAMDVLAGRVREQWEQTPPFLRDRLIAAAIVGGLIGLLTGILATSLCAAAVTAIGGALAMLVGGAAAVVRVTGEEPAWLPQEPRHWLIWWAIISVIGLAIQWTTRPRRADKPA